MPSEPPIEEVAAELAEQWARHPVTEGFRLEGSRAAGADLEVAFRWRLDPQPYLVRFAYPGWIPEAIGDGFTAAEAVQELALRLMEELDTGFVARAGRERVGDAVLLLDRPSRHSGWSLGSVPVVHSPGTAARGRAAGAASGERFAVVADHGGPTEPIADAGRFLDRAGFDGGPGRRAVADGSLVSWRQVDGGAGGTPRVGQAVVVRVDERTARIAALEVATEDPAALEDLVLAACRDAIEAGAHEVEAARELTALLAFGFHDDGDRLVAAFDEVRRPG